MFGFLSEIEGVSNSVIREKSAILLETYKDDISEEIVNELLHFRELVKQMKLKEDESKELQMFRLTVDEKLKNTFLNVFILLRIHV